jgi:uncharacterized membrane protein
VGFRGVSLESAKKLGFTASIIQITMPIIAIVAVITLYVSLFSSIFSSIGTGITPTFSFFSVFGGALIFLIAVGVVAFVGYILFLIAMHRLSQYYNEKAIFKNVLNALIIQIIFTSVLLAIMLVVIPTLAGNMALTSTTGVTSTLWSFIVIYLVVIAISIVVSIYCALLYKRAFYKLSEKSGVDNFRTMGLLYLIGTALSFVGGSVIVWIAWIFAAMGFRKLAPALQATAPSTYYMPNQAPQTNTTKPCPTCGAENSTDRRYCAHCGKQL